MGNIKIEPVEENQSNRLGNWMEAYKSFEESYPTAIRAKANESAVLTTSQAVKDTISSGEQKDAESSLLLPSFHKIVNSASQMWSAVYHSIFTILSPSEATISPISDSTGIKPIGAPTLKPPPAFEVAETRKLVNQIQDLLKRINNASMEMQDELKRQERQSTAYLFLAAFKSMERLYEDAFLTGKLRLVTQHLKNQETTEELLDLHGQKAKSQKNLRWWDSWHWSNLSFATKSVTVVVSVVGTVALGIFAAKQRNRGKLRNLAQAIPYVLKGLKASSDLVTLRTQMIAQDILAKLAHLDVLRGIVGTRIQDMGKLMERAANSILEIFTNLKRLEDLKNKTVKSFFRG